MRWASLCTVPGTVHVQRYDHVHSAELFSALEFVVSMTGDSIISGVTDSTAGRHVE